MAELTPSYSSSSGLAPRTLALSILLLGVAAWQAKEVRSACPHDVSLEAHACFTGYSREYQNMKSSPKRLCCGVDVENLRAFCSSYMKAMTCIAGLREQCPGEKASIDKSMTNLHGAESALKALCADDTIIEVYARHQSCITKAGPTTESCIQRYLNTTDNVRLLASVDTQQISRFCRDMRGTLQCVQNNVRNQCGPEAAMLAAVLVKPMVRQSTQCDYSIITNMPDSRQSQPSPSPQDGSPRQTEPASGSAASVSSALVLLCLSCVTRTLLLAS